MDEKTTVTENANGPVVTVTLNRPEQHNAFTSGMVKELTESFRRLSERTDVRVVILTGNGRSFCAGADLNSMVAAADNSYDDNLEDAEAIYDLMYAVDNCPYPVIGRINGAAFGGGVGLVSCCDIAVAVERARFALSEVRLGLVPAVISPFVLPKIGSNNARELFLTGERISAKRAKEIGLVQHVVEESWLDEAISERVQELLLSGPEAIDIAKKLIKSVVGHTQVDIRALTTRSIADRRSSLEGREGMSAFLEKRKPEWRED